MDQPVLINWRERITADPAVMVGQPVIRGMRITVSQILARLAGGWTEAELLAATPRLEREDIQACLAFASEVIHETKLQQLPAA